MSLICTNQTAGEGTTDDVGSDGVADQSAVLGGAAVGRVDGHVAFHILQSEFATAVTSHHAAGMFIRSIDGSSGNKILDGGAIGVAEGTTKFGIGGMVEGKGVTVAVESAVECIVSIPVRMIAHHGSDLDVVHQLEVGAAVCGAVVHIGGQCIPMPCAGNLVGVTHCAAAEPIDEVGFAFSQDDDGALVGMEHGGRVSRTVVGGIARGESANAISKGHADVGIGGEGAIDSDGLAAGQIHIVAAAVGGVVVYLWAAAHDEAAIVVDAAAVGGIAASDGAAIHFERAGIVDDTAVVGGASIPFDGAADDFERATALDVECASIAALITTFDDA